MDYQTILSFLIFVSLLAFTYYYAQLVALENLKWQSYLSKNVIYDAKTNRYYDCDLRYDYGATENKITWECDKKTNIKKHYEV